MKQVQLKIEEFYENEVICRYESLKNIELVNQIEIVLIENKKNSREMIISNLWDLQCDLLVKPWKPDIQKRHFFEYSLNHGIYITKKKPVYETIFFMSLEKEQ